MNILRAVSFILITCSLSMAFGSEKLSTQLDALTESFKGKMPEEKKAIMEGAIEKLRQSKILQTALKEGQTAPSFQLKDAKGEMIDSANLLKSGPLVIVFYRGSWCPYCNLQLHALQERVQEIKDLGATLVAVSPEKPDGSLTTVQKHNLTFHVLSDPHLKISKKFGIVYKLPPDLKKLYLSFGNDLAKRDGAKEWELPLAATYIIDTDGKITYSFVDVDYRKRAEPDDIVAALKKISKK